MNYLECLRGLREDGDFTQQRIADMLGVAQNTYSQYEVGINAMPLDVFVALCKFYGVSTDYVLGLSTEKTIINPVVKNKAQ